MSDLTVEDLDDLDFDSIRSDLESLMQKRGISGDVADLLRRLAPPPVSVAAANAAVRENIEQAKITPVPPMPEIDVLPPKPEPEPHTGRLEPPRGERISAAEHLARNPIKGIPGQI